MLISRMSSPPVHKLARAGLTVLGLLFAGSLPGAGPAPRFTIQRRAVNQDQGGWRVDYRLRYDGPSGIVLTPTEVWAKVESWVSNSRVASHAIPRWSSLAISGPSGLSATADVITASDEAQRCRERVSLVVWTGEDGPPEVPAAKPGIPPAGPLLSLAPGGTLYVRLRWEHQHFLYGDYDPLLGQRALELRLGSATLRDVLPMDQEHYLALPKFAWPVPPEDRRDTRYFYSAPDSLHLEAHVPGNQYYRFPERPVRYGTKMRLRFWYLVAPGTEGECRARIAQYKDTPTAWRVLTDGAYEECLTTVGRWVKVEHIFRTEPDATTLALDFRISGADIGEMWIDDVTLEPVGAPPSGP
ncbi:MAG: hypothetical protein P4L84_35915 [Isosphaeraceae bacterium]|nr:hypothetical protein [Isosphaeraceae bacterium]